MLALLLAASLAPQVTSIHFDDPSGEEDNAWTWFGAFDPTRDAFWIANSSTDQDGSRIARLDLATGSVPDVLNLPERAFYLEATPDGSTLVALRLDGDVQIIDLAAGTVRANLAGNFIGAGEVDTDSMGSRAIAFSTCGDRGVTVIDLGTASIERQFQLPVPPACATKSFMAGDDVTLAVAGSSNFVTVNTVTEIMTGSLAMQGDIPFALDHDASRNIAVVFSHRQDGNVVTSIDVATSTVIGRRFVPGQPLEFGSSGHAVDDSGTRAVFNSAEGAVFVDLAAGTWRLLSNTRGPVGLTHDGSRAFVVGRSHLELRDVQTGQLLSRRKVPGRGRRVDAMRHPLVDQFVLDADARVEVLDLTGPVPAILDTNPGAGPEADGPFALAVDPTGTFAAVTARDSYDLRLVDLSNASVAQRVDVGAQPVDVAFASDGALLVAHAAGEKVTEFDPVTLAEIASIGLPGRAVEMWVEDDPNLAWFHVQGDVSRLIVRVNRSSGGLDRVVRLRSGVDPDEYLATFPSQSLRPKVVIDLGRGLAYALHQTAGLLDTHELSSGMLVSSINIAPGAGVDGALALSPSGDALAHQGASLFTVYDLGAAGPSARWQSSTCERFEAVVPAWLGEDIVTIDCAEGKYWNAANGVVLNSAPTPFFSHDGEIHDGRTWASIRNDVVLGEGVYLSRVDALGTFEKLGAQPIVTDGNEPSTLLLEPVTGTPVILGAGPAGAGLHLLDLTPAPPQLSCSPADTNAFGARASIAVNGLFSAGSSLTIRTSGLEPGGMPSLLLISSLAGPPRPVLISGRSLCLAASPGRFNGSVGLANAAGVRSVRVDTEALPIPGLSVAQPGTSWTFQTWYRDRTQTGAPTDNASDAVTVLLR